MKPFLSTLTAAVVVLGVAVGPAHGMSYSVTKTCAAVATPTGLSSRITVKQVGCTKARSVARTYANKGKAPAGWFCKSLFNGVGATVHCRHSVGTNVQRISFQIAD
jgi:hypothetical protein